MSPRDNDKSISRRSMLKRIGAGAAVAWTAPVLTSLRTPAFGQRYFACATCQEVGCIDGTEVACSQDPFCLCATEQGGAGCVCFDVNTALCTNPVCTTTADCPSGMVCIAGCANCGGPGEPPSLRCVFPCGQAAGTGTGQSMLRPS